MLSTYYKIELGFLVLCRTAEKTRLRTEFMITDLLSFQFCHNSQFCLCIVSVARMLWGKSRKTMQSLLKRNQSELCLNVLCKELSLWFQLDPTVLCSLMHCSTFRQNFGSTHPAYPGTSIVLLMFFFFSLEYSCIVQLKCSVQSLWLSMKRVNTKSLRTKPL